MANTGVRMGRLILLILQLVVGWFAGQAIVRWLGLNGGLPVRLALYVAVFAALCWIVGLVAGEVLQGTSRPSARALASALIGGAIGAAVLFIPQLKPYLGNFNDLYLPLIGAVLGYQVRA